jgi:hypothetical protein
VEAPSTLSPPLKRLEDECIKILKDFQPHINEQEWRKSITETFLRAVAEGKSNDEIAITAAITMMLLISGVRPNEVQHANR